MSAPSDFASRWHTVGALRLHALVTDNGATGPTGPTVVLLPGLVTASRSMVPLARALTTRGFRVWVLDPPGFGYSSKPTRALAMTEQAGIVAAWLRGTGLAPACLLGNSFGSQVAAAVAAAHPDTVARLVLVAPTAGPRIRRLTSWMHALPEPVGSRDQAAGRVRAWLLGRAHDALSDPPSLRILNVAEYACASLPRAVSTIRCAVLERVENVLPDVTVPTVVLRADRDHLSSLAWAEGLVAGLPDGRLVRLRGLGHAAFYSRPDAVADPAEHFLTGAQLTSSG